MGLLLHTRYMGCPGGRFLRTILQVSYSFRLSLVLLHILDLAAGGDVVELDEVALNFGRIFCESSLQCSQPIGSMQIESLLHSASDLLTTAIVGAQQVQVTQFGEGFD